jgi:hypothetical protein
MGRFFGTVLRWAAWGAGLGLVLMFGSALVGLPLSWWQSFGFGVMLTVFWKWQRFWQGGNPYRSPFP